MSGQLKRKEPVGRGLRRVCKLRLKKALANLKKSDQPDAIHDVRKEVKKMRAVFRLGRAALGKKQYRKTAKTVRLAGKPLAAVRDARVTAKALELFAGKKASEFQGIKSSLEAYFAHSEWNFANNDSASLAELALKNVDRQLTDLNLKQAGWKDIRKCLKGSYTRGREAFQQAIAKPVPENLHAWRKRVKDLWYQLDFLCPEWPKDSKEILDSLEQLGEELGEDHDLVLLEHFVKEHCDASPEAKELQHRIEVKRREYGTGARQLGARIYAKLPEEICAKLEKDWKNWHKGK